MIAYTRAQIVRLLKIDFVRFCIVGGLGFVINFILLNGLHKIFGLPIFFAQLIAAEIALGCNFALHHNWTYKHHKVRKSLPQLVVQFHVTSWPAITGSALMVHIGVKLFHFSSLVALIISSVIALFWNFVWSKFVVWRDVTEADIKEAAE